MLRNALIAVFVVLLSGCAASLSREGQQVRLISDQSAADCVFVGVVTGSNSRGYSTAQDAEGAMNELRNKAAQQGANAIRIVDIDSNENVTTAVAESLSCDY